MFTCEIVVFLPLQKAGEKSPLFFTVAQYNFDPGLYPEDIVRINDASFVQTIRNGKRVEVNEPRFSFEAKVLRCRKIIEPRVPQDDFTLVVDVEIADKELIPEIVKLCKDTFPGHYEDFSL